MISVDVHDQHSVSEALPRGAVDKKRVPTPLRDGFDGCESHNTEIDETRFHETQIGGLKFHEIS